ncbi:MAG: PrgI family protein [Candidatus Colwellbacteria bacterium]|nr:PrgI family protein [Candidatus Colwellbacteria bacterium]
MPQFQVPQFIETEDKIFGPFTLKQFLYIAAAGFLSFVFFFIVELWLWFLITVVLGAAASALAFVKIHGRSAITVAFSAFKYIWSPRLYIFKTKTPAPEQKIPGGALRNIGEKLATTKSAIPKRESFTPHIFNPFKDKEKEEQYEAIQRITGDKEIARRVDYR